jgi:hypothetical protein
MQKSPTQWNVTPGTTFLNYWMISFSHPLWLRISQPIALHLRKWRRFSTSSEKLPSFRQFVPISPHIPAIRLGPFPLFHVPSCVQ